MFAAVGLGPTLPQLVFTFQNINRFPSFKENNLLKNRMPFFRIRKMALTEWTPILFLFEEGSVL
jgi:hypothetical protein